MESTGSKTTTRGIPEVVEFSPVSAPAEDGGVHVQMELSVVEDILNDIGNGASTLCEHGCLSQQATTGGNTRPEMVKSPLSVLAEDGGVQMGSSIDGGGQIK